MPHTIDTAQAQLRNRRTTATALVDSCLQAIDAHNSSTNTFVTIAAAHARHAAHVRDTELSEGRDRGPLHGIPITIKDIIDQAGHVTTAASHVLDDRTATEDAAVVRRLEQAGAIIIGRANLHQFALGTTSEDSAFGPVRNPRDTTRVAGGSSGGSAAAVAAGMAIASVGTDTGASVRVPAAVCGVVGLKPSFDDVPTAGVIPLSTTLDHVGPLAQTVQDAAWMWQVMADRPVATVAPPAPGQLRLAALGGYFTELLDPVVRAAFTAALHALRAQGVSFVDATMTGTDRIGPTYADIVLSEAAHWHRPYLDSRKDKYLPPVHARISHGRTILAADYIEALETCVRLRHQVDTILDTNDAIVLPTLPIVAPPVGTTDIVLDEHAGGAPLPVRAVMLRLTQLFNLTRHPAISLPIASSGLPVGLQLVGRRNDTAGLLDVAAACERALADANRSA